MVLRSATTANANRWKDTMQTIGYIKPAGVKILVLVRISNSPNADHVTMKIRKSGQDGSHFSDEEKYLEGEPEKLFALLNGKVVIC